MVVQGEVSKASAICGVLWEGILSDADDDSKIMEMTPIIII